jgi:hypothetical protein
MRTAMSQPQHMCYTSACGITHQPPYISMWHHTPTTVTVCRSLLLQATFRHSHETCRCKEGSAQQPNYPPCTHEHNICSMYAHEHTDMSPPTRTKHPPVACQLLPSADQSTSLNPFCCMPGYCTLYQGMSTALISLVGAACCMSQPSK